MNAKKLELITKRFVSPKIKKMSSALKFGLIATGEGDFYPRLGPTHEWDTAAGQCIIEEAGGKVNKISDYETNKIDIRAGNPNIYEKMIKKID